MILFIILGIVLFSLVFLGFNNLGITGKSIVSENIKIEPLSDEQRQKVVSILEISEFIEDLPSKGVVSLRFFEFKNGKRIWQENFLIGQNEILQDGEPDIYISLHSKYISEFDENSLCDVIKKADENGDLGFYSDDNIIKLVFRYRGMLKHRDCFGF